MLMMARGRNGYRGKSQECGGSNRKISNEVLTGHGLRWGCSLGLRLPMAGEYSLRAEWTWCEQAQQGGGGMGKGR